MKHLTVADLYAVKSAAKEKEAYFRSIKHVLPEYAEEQQKYADILFHADKELSERLNHLYHVKQSSSEV